MPIPPWLESQIPALLQEGLSDRQIAARLGVGRGTIANVRTGKRSPCLARDRAKANGAPKPPRRCPTCGRLTSRACTVCAVRRLASEGVLPLIGDRHAPDDLRVDLRGEQRQRYLRLKAEKDRELLAAGTWPADRLPHDGQQDDVREPTNAELAVLQRELDFEPSQS